MTNELDIIRALVELGDEFPSAYCEWEYGVSRRTAWGFMAGGEYLMRWPGGNDIGQCPHADAPMEFLEAAANARPALRAMLARLEKLEGALKEIATHDHGSPERYEGSNTGDAETYGYDLASHALGSIAAAALKEAQDA